MSMIIPPQIDRLLAAYVPQDQRGGHATSDARFFLSVIMRTTGQRMSTLREALVSLLAQDTADFEIILIVHEPNGSVLQEVQKACDPFQARLRDRLKIVSCARPGRSAPLNDALAWVNGHYVAVLDDDDLVLPSWVSVFKQLAQRNPNKLLRSGCVRQDWCIEQGTDGAQTTRLLCSDYKPWPLEYDAIRHIQKNQTPFMSFAIPRVAFLDLGLRFDETLPVLEDWKLTTICAMLFGVASSPEVTAIYRWWTDLRNSHAAHNKAEWDQIHSKIVEYTNERPIVLPPGSAVRLAQLLEIEDKWLRSQRRKPLRRLIQRVTRSIRELKKKFQTVR